jgi:hypothetical protein
VNLALLQTGIRSVLQFRTSVSTIHVFVQAWEECTAGFNSGVRQNINGILHVNLKCIESTLYERKQIALLSIMHITEILEDGFTG